MPTVVELTAVGLILLVNAFFVMAEYALVSMRRTRLQALVNSGDARARLVADLLDAPVRFVSAIQLGVTVSSLALGAVGQPAISALLDTPLGAVPAAWREEVSLVVSVLIAFAVLSFLHVVVGEIVPKSIGLQHGERVALGVARPVYLFSAAFRPFVWLLVATSSAILRRLGLPPPVGVSLAHSEEELKLLVTASRRQGVLQQGEQEMLHRVFEFADKDAADVMVPRPDMVALPVETAVDEAIDVVLAHPYTRYPVFRDDLDDIAGIVHVRDLFRALHTGSRESLAALVRPAIVVPETKSLDALLAEFRRTSSHLAIVVDEYGSVAGLATLEDLLEEIVGEIGDEFDLPDRAIRRIGRGRLRIEGAFPIDEFNDRFAKELPSEDYHTVGGFVFGELGRAPHIGDVVSWDGIRFEVATTDGPRIVEVDVTLLPPRPQAARAENGR